MRENKLKLITKILEVTEAAMRPLPKFSYVILTMCRKFTDKNDRSNPGSPERTEEKENIS